MLTQYDRKRARKELMRGVWWAASFAVIASVPVSTGADVYAYDARGRLVGACQTTGGNYRRTEYLLDNADNRTNYRNLPVIVFIPTNSSLYSADGRFQLIMQNDGNLVLYGPSGALWSSNTYGSGSQNIAVMQADGNLVIYNQQGLGAVWSTVTAGNTCARLSLQNDGNLIIYDLSLKPIWSSNTGGH